MDSKFESTQRIQCPTPTKRWFATVLLRIANGGEA